MPQVFWTTLGGYKVIESQKWASLYTKRTLSLFTRSTSGTALGFMPLSSEACVFVSQDFKVWIILYVDDMAIAAATKEQIEQVAYRLGETFALTVLDEVDHFLGLQIVRDRKLKTIQITQEPVTKRRSRQCADYCWPVMRGSSRRDSWVAVTMTVTRAAAGVTPATIYLPFPTLCFSGALVGA
jgi:hypothetical protein